MNCKKAVPKNFAKFTGNQLCQSPFPNKVAGLSLINYLRIKLGKFGDDLSVFVLKPFPEVSTLSSLMAIRFIKKVDIQTF